MRLGLRTLLVLVAVILFVLAALTDENSFDFLAIGLAVLAASFVIDEVAGGWGTRADRR